MGTSRALNIATITALVATLVGCTSAAPETSAPPPKPSVSPTAPTSAAPSDTLDDDGRNAGTATAEAALTAFLQRDLPYEAWWAQLKPMLTQEAVFAYEYTDPQSVPATTITGEPLVSAAPSATQLNVLIPTGVGQYMIVLYRENARAGWAVDRLTPPEQAGP